MMKKWRVQSFSKRTVKAILTATSSKFARAGAARRQPHTRAKFDVKKVVGGVVTKAVSAQFAITRLKPALKSIFLSNLAVFLGFCASPAQATEDLKSRAQRRIVRVYRRYFFQTPDKKSSVGINGLLPQRNFVSWSTADANALLRQLRQVC
jgi:hypothetical protein